MHALDVVDEECIHWLTRHGVAVGDGSSLRAIQSSRLAAYTFPRTLDRERLRLSTDLIAWLFIFDDAFAEGELRREPRRLAECHARFDGVLAGDGARANADPWESSLEDLLARFANVAPREWLTRLRQSILGYFLGCERECTYRARDVWPTLTEYLEYRDDSIGVYPMLDLIELTTGQYLEPELLRCQRLRDAKRLGNLAIAITNDIHSSKKEALEQDSFNAVAVIMRQYRVERSRALRMTQPRASKHLRVLRAVGLVRVRGVGKQRLYALDARGLRPIHEWVGGFERFWNESFDRLNEYVKELQRKESMDGKRK